MKFPADLIRIFRPTQRRLKWTTDDKFALEGVRFHCSTDAKAGSPRSRVGILKSRGLLEAYVELVERTRPERALEIGFRHGGSALFLAKLAGLQKLLGIDLRPETPSIRETIRKHGEGSRITLKFGTRQDDSAAVRGAIEHEFGSQLLDLIVDDASHMYGPSRATFEATFAYLRPGGAYVIEDWGWAHWPGTWQTSGGPWPDQPALTNLIFELVMVAASRPDIVARVDVANPAMAIITRGEGLVHGQAIQLDACHSERGRRLDLI